MRFSAEELRDLFKAWVAISLAIAIATLGFDAISVLGFPVLVRAFAIYSLTVGVAFVAHELLGHKLVAQRYHLFAEFRADDLFLLLAVLLSFTGFVFAAPGAVVIGGVTRIDTYGKIAAAGSVVNILLAMTFGLLSSMGISLSLPLYDQHSIDLIGISYQINSWLALFNLLPIGVLDGAKVLAWNKKVWLLLIAIAALLFFQII
jgi:Zn-dependent protease